MTVAAKDGKTGMPVNVQYTHYRVLGNGTFGVVFEADLVSNNQHVAIKKVIQDKSFKVSRFLFIRSLES